MTPPRNHSFDNLRALMVLCIVLLHAACAYAAIIPWWHARDAQAPVFDILILLIDTFALPVLFFVAGVFATPSLDRNGTAGFLKAKSQRLGIPLLALPIIYLPTMVYLGYLHRTETPLTFFRYWMHWISTFTDWGFVVIADMQQGAHYADAVSPHHLWFLSLLLLFFLAYAGCRRLFRFRPNFHSLKPLILLAIMIPALGFAAINLLVPDWAWARFGPFLLFQPTRLPLYAGIFVFGVLARPHVDSPRPFPGTTWLWLLLFLSAQAAMLALVPTFMTTPSSPLGYAAIHGLLRAVMAVSATALAVNLTRRFLAGPSPWRESLSKASYTIYIWHMPLVVYAQAVLLHMPLPLWVKAATAFTVPVTICWGISQAEGTRSRLLQLGLASACFFGFLIFI
ncbi:MULTISPECIES: acyltransferase family protein [unclassified Pseudodesulfovibrio]|uniref:acyltransferase family protein n=1 Tax=unclassified Pseudodesulfovibrio TaxID=2661612 RepID=UPI000FEC1F43|nr:MULTISPECIES: acyltransferase family protein [unclassified Pseudodesulfovibrio]MCJ2165572.1 acyltransferase family protein [Pseudodesulfovibrio sp. S3-i]RWU03068.1 hypothetical protein DWB63_12740 [Pseudodesulfovibrio sp. S3]